jgi:type II secretory pathway component PulF
MTDSYISHSNGGTMFAGPDATELVRATMLRHAIKIAQSGMMLTRGMTLTKSMKMAERYTGRKYKRGQADQARADLTVWIETMRSALPIREG